MKITWVVRSFLDYRIPIYQKLSECEGIDFTLISSSDTRLTPESVQRKAKAALGSKLILLSGEKCIGKRYDPKMPSQNNFRVYYQPGLIKRIEETAPDIILTDAFNHWTLPVLWLRAKSKRFKHIVCYERTAYNERNAPYLKRKYIGLVSRFIDAVHCNGVLCKDFLRSLGYPERKLHLGNMAADNSFFTKLIKPQEREKIRTELGLKGTTYVYSGRLIPLKGVRELLQTWERFVAGKTDEVSLMLIGGGPLQQELNDFCQKKGLKNVHILGRVNYDLLPPYYQAADCFLIPTLDDNWSLVVPEAMAAGLPILCSKYNGCHPELVHPDNGWVFDPLDPANFEEMLETSFRARTKFPEMGARSREIVQDFSPDAIVHKLYQTCLDLTKK